MAYFRMPPPSIEDMLAQMAEGFAQHAQAKVTVRWDYQDGTHHESMMDCRGVVKRAEQGNLKGED